MKRSRFTEEQIAFVLKQSELGTPVAEVCRKMGVSDATLYNWRKKYGGLGSSELLRQSIAETLTYYGFPDSHWRRIRTNNPQERIMREIRRRARVVGAFPDGRSALMLCAARLRHIAGTQWGTRRYLDMSPFHKQQELEEQLA